MTEWAVRLSKDVLVDFGLPGKIGEPNEDYPLAALVDADSLCHDFWGIITSIMTPAPILVNEDYRILLLCLVFYLENIDKRRRIEEEVILRNQGLTKGNGVIVVTTNEELYCPLLEDLKRLCQKSNATILKYTWKGGKRVYVRVFFCVPFAPSLTSPEDIMRKVVEGIKGG
jgi:hypothetical protein